MERVLVTLTPSEAKRLIGKAVAMMEPVRECLKKGTIVICLGTTNAYVAEEILGRRIEEKGMFSMGVITPEGTCISNSDRRLKERVIMKGKLTRLGLKDVIEKLGPSDVFIKGANAIDPWGNAGVYLGSATGGTVGMSIGVLLARGVKIIVPVSLEKCIPYAILDLVPRLGNQRFLASMNLPVGIMPIPGEVVTEIEAVNTLFGCECLPIGGGGINGGEGSRCYLIEGDGESVRAAWDGVLKIKGEKPVAVEVEDCKKCKMRCRKGLEGAT
jgi:hypothetical protein